MTLAKAGQRRGGGGWHERVEHKRECVLDVFYTGA